MKNKILLIAMLSSLFFMSCRKQSEDVDKNNIVTNEQTEQEISSNVVNDNTISNDESISVNEDSESASDEFYVIPEDPCPDLILYSIRIDRKWGFIDYEGNIVIPCIYSSVSDFVDGISEVSTENEDFYINKLNEKVDYKGPEIHTPDPYTLDYVEGKEPDVIPEGYKLSRETSCIGEDFFTVELIEDDYYAAVISKDGKLVIPAEIYDIGPFRNGMAPFKHGHAGIDGYLRKDGVVFDFY